MTAANIHAVITGTPFEDGGPAFLIEAGHYPIGAGIIPPQIDSPMLYAFDVPDDTLANAVSITVKFLNDHYTPEGGDRNLRVISVSVNGVTFRAEQITTNTPQGTRAEDPGLLLTNTWSATVARPSEGWPVQGTTAE